MNRLDKHWRKSIRTSYRLWGVISAVLFIAAGCVTWDPNFLGTSYWAYWRIFQSRDYACSTTAIVLILALWGLVMAVPSAALGWIGHAAALLIRDPSWTQRF
jgi:hypothetical protein